VTKKTPEQSGDIDIQIEPAGAKTKAKRGPPEAMIREALARAGVLAMRIIGPPGSGKTELIEATLKGYPAPRRVAVIAVGRGETEKILKSPPQVPSIAFADFF
jgi:Ni2+-binding GTPase involved in maturation of urease and hydrogenase